MKIIDTTKREVCILVFLIILICVYATQSLSESMTGTLKPIFPAAEDINETVNTDYAESIEKFSLGAVIPENIKNPHPYLVAITLDGHKIAYGVSKGGKNWFMMSNDKKGPEFNSVSFPVFSPDGNKLAYAAMQNGKWFIVMNDKKGPEFDVIYSDYTFSPDSSKFAYGVKRGGEAFIVVDDKEEGGFDAVASPVFSPAGNKLAYFAIQNDKPFVVVNGKKGPEHDDFRRDIVFSPDEKK